MNEPATPEPALSQRSDDVLERFSPATAAWFRGSFTAPTPAQAGAWDAVSSGRDALVVAPTGSGKPLAAFLWSLDRLLREPVPEEPLRRCRVVYVSPLKALAVDVERNLRAPLVGIGHAAHRLGASAPEVTVALRSGDTPAADRRAFAKRPSDILITTPESLFLILTSAAREALAGAETVTPDEGPAGAGTNRRPNLALTLHRAENPSPAETESNPGASPVTGVGTVVSVVVPKPSSPRLFSPQAHSEPSAATARECSVAASTVRQSDREPTRVGTNTDVEVAPRPT